MDINRSLIRIWYFSYFITTWYFTVIFLLNDCVSTSKERFWRLWSFTLFWIYPKHGRFVHLACIQMGGYINTYSPYILIQTSSNPLYRCSAFVLSLFPRPIPPSSFFYLQFFVWPYSRNFFLHFIFSFQKFYYWLGY